MKIIREFKTVVVNKRGIWFNVVVEESATNWYIYYKNMEWAMYYKEKVKKSKRNISDIILDVVGV